MPTDTALSRLDLTLEIKAVDATQRIIEGYCAIFNVPDLGNDIIEPGAFNETLAGRPMTDVKVFIGHHGEDLPVGYPIEIRADSRGLYTRTKVLPTTAGDDLLKAAEELRLVGAPLGMSIGYRTEQDAMEEVNGQWVRRLKKLYLGEYSYVGMPMHPLAGVTAVKSQDSETLTGSALALKNASATLDKLATQAALDQKAMAQLGMETKDGATLRPALAEQVKSTIESLSALLPAEEPGTEGQAGPGDGEAADISGNRADSGDADVKTVIDLDLYRRRLELLAL